MILIESREAFLHRLMIDCPLLVRIQNRPQRRLYQEKQDEESMRRNGMEEKPLFYSSTKQQLLINWSRQWKKITISRHRKSDVLRTLQLWIVESSS